MSKKSPISSMKFSRNGKIFLLVFAILFVGGILAFRYSFPEVARMESVSRKSIDGETIYFDIYEPKDPIYSPGSPNKKIGVIIGHGVMVNRGVMRLLAIELASNGFVVASFDFRSHGRSTGDLGTMGLKAENIANYSALALDIQCIKEYMAERGDIDMKNLGYIGYSMGGGAGMTQLFRDNDFNAMVGFAPAAIPEKMNETNPKNYLIMIGKFDEAIPMSYIYESMYNRTGLSESGLITGNLYGSFQNGTASELYYDPYVDHFFAPYYPAFISRAVVWMRAALHGEDYQTLLQNYHLKTYTTLISSAIASMLGGLGLIILAGAYLFGKNRNKGGKMEIRIIDKKNSQEFNIESIEKSYLIYTALFALPSMLFLLPIFFSQAAFSFILLGIIWGPAISLIYLIKSKIVLTMQKDGTSDSNKEELQISGAIGYLLKGSLDSREMTLSILFGGAFYGILILTLGQIFDVVPSTTKFIWILIIFPISFISILLLAISYYILVVSHRTHVGQHNLGSEISDRRDLGVIRMKDMIKRPLFFFTFNLLINIALILLIICLFFGNLFPFMVFYAAAPLFLIVIFLMNALIKPSLDSPPLISIAAICAIPVSAIILTVTPLLF